MTYGCLMQGAKGILHWGYGVNKLNPDSWFGKEHHALRISMGGLPGNMAYGYRIPNHIVSNLKAVWNEIGRINAELQTIGSLVAISDISNLAKITKVSPEIGSGFTGKRSAEVASLICGTDSLILIILNMNLNTHWKEKRKQDERIISYEPVDVTVEVKVPPWLKPEDIFSVDYRKLKRIEVKKRNNNIELHFPKLAVSQIVVITQDKTLYLKMEKTLKEMQQRLKAISTDKPMPFPGLCEKQTLKRKRIPKDKSKDIVYLSDLKPESAKQGWGKLIFDKSVEEKPLTIANTIFEKGLGTHAHSEIIYRLDNGYSFLEGFIGLDQEVVAGSIIFQIYGDDEKLYESKILSYFTKPEKFSVSVKGKKKLRLVVTDAGDGSGADHADWADIKLRK